MNFPKTNIDETLIMSLARKHGIREISLFGSVLTDRFNDGSDLDLLVDFLPGRGKSYFDIIDIREDFEKSFGRHVDIIERSALKNPYRKKSILDSAVKVYEAQ